MQVQREFSDKILVQKIESMPIDELRKSLGLEPQKEQKTPSQSSKWARVVKEIEALNISVETGEFIRKCSKEFREEF